MAPKADAALNRLIRDVDILISEMSLVSESQRAKDVKHWTVWEVRRLSLVSDTIMSLETPLRQYFEMMPSEEDAEWAVANEVAEEEPETLKRFKVKLRKLLRNAEELRELREQIREEPQR